MDDLKKDEIWVGTEKFVPYLTAEVIQKRVAELGKQLSEEYKSKLPIFIGVLNGSFMFMADLLKNISINCEMDFFKLSSYGDTKISSGKVKLVKDLNADITDRHLIIVEDIVDSGLSIKYIEELIAEHKPASMKVASLLYKPDSLKYDVKIDYIGFEIPSKFVIGYGLDYAQKYRNLPSIYALSE
ncbi:MAG: hypoxanthine phosphoribosyltransferase [Ignavibacteriales bacterium]|nr:MAG: hypoxanthine phosphoribosyltransferase [Stygiobacter sp.]KAF0214747.1 MAG: hypoxanthine [Ignavibacteria bacterium]MBI3125270.1 hypoxanthine phosphoribosyltransferase [Ignavibacteriales bacterium]OGU64650.1 MAG: hypoxanthine phosphoribosyltransferase [Stygiobacter sp. GWC2_38_9]OGU81065.1 MAG: hypoxanthine phosphoribosyltransferase [Stygiobacter sp. RIFOXYA12_FULL_38_9]OGV09797.1 MAG: hypoxanthine phosphoribosyltransferase [Stygiobacter sp. RIFOXYB2_FULL_37_11]OGV13667.1 MAG: hypoxanth